VSRHVERDLPPPDVLFTPAAAPLDTRHRDTCRRRDLGALNRLRAWNRDVDHGCLTTRRVLWIDALGSNLHLLPTLRKDRDNGQEGDGDSEDRAHADALHVCHPFGSRSVVSTCRLPLSTFTLQSNAHLVDLKQTATIPSARENDFLEVRIVRPH